MGGNEKVALPTAYVKILSNNKMAEGRILLDMGSQRTLISQDLVKKLELTPTAVVAVSIQGINSKESPQDYNIYDFHISTNEGLVKLDALAVKHLPLVTMPGLDKIISKLKNKGEKLADAELIKAKDGKVSVDILLGSDYYFNVVKDKGMVVYDKLRLLPSKLGLVAVGPYSAEGAVGSEDLTDHLTILNVSELTDNHDIFKNIDKVQQITLKNSWALVCPKNCRWTRHWPDCIAWIGRVGLNLMMILKNPL